MTRSVLAEMRRVMRYDPETGVFTRIVSTSSNARVGARAGSINGGGYRYISVAGVCYKANRLAWLWMTGSWPVGVVDHENGCPSDDRWSNLRDASHQQNMANAKKRRDNSSGAKGVREFRGRWQARIGRGGSKHIGTFDSFDEALAAYRAAAASAYGKFARPE